MDFQGSAASCRKGLCLDWEPETTQVKKNEIITQSQFVPTTQLLIIEKHTKYATQVTDNSVCVYLSVCTVLSLSPRPVPQYSPVCPYTSMVRASLMTSRRLMAVGEARLQWSVRTQEEPSSVCSSNTGPHLTGKD